MEESVLHSAAASQHGLLQLSGRRSTHSRDRCKVHGLPQLKQLGCACAPLPALPNLCAPLRLPARLVLVAVVGQQSGASQPGGARSLQCVLLGVLVTLERQAGGEIRNEVKEFKP